MEEQTDSPKAFGEIEEDEELSQISERSSLEKSIYIPNGPFDDEPYAPEGQYEYSINLRPHEAETSFLKANNPFGNDPIASQSIYQPNEELEYSYNLRKEQENKEEQREHLKSREETMGIASQKNKETAKSAKKGAKGTLKLKSQQIKKPLKIETQQRNEALSSDKMENKPKMKRLVIYSGSQSSSPSSQTVIDLPINDEPMIVVINRPRALTSATRCLLNGGSIYAGMPQFHPSKIKERLIRDTHDRIELFIHQKNQESNAENEGEIQQKAKSEMECLEPNDVESPEDQNESGKTKEKEVLQRGNIENIQEKNGIVKGKTEKKTKEKGNKSLKVQKEKERPLNFAKKTENKRNEPKSARKTTSNQFFFNENNFESLQEGKSPSPAKTTGHKTKKQPQKTAKSVQKDPTYLYLNRKRFDLDERLEEEKDQNEEQLEESPNAFEKEATSPKKESAWINRKIENSPFPFPINKTTSASPIHRFMAQVSEARKRTEKALSNVTCLFSFEQTPMK